MTHNKPTTTTATVQVPQDKVAMRAYEKWCKRGRTHGHHMQDWLEAEAEVRAEISRTGTTSTTSGVRR